MVIDKVRILVCLNVIHVMDELEITTSSTHTPTAQTPVMDVENSREEASDNADIGDVVSVVRQLNGVAG
jgi:hypothetical protein